MNYCQHEDVRVEEVEGVERKGRLGRVPIWERGVIRLMNEGEK